jgi:hypothetical protein
MHMRRPRALDAGAARTGQRAPAEVAEVQAQDVRQAAHTLQGKCTCQCLLLPANAAHVCQPG